MKKYTILLSILCTMLCVGCGTQKVEEQVEEQPTILESVLEVDGKVEARKSEEIHLEFPSKIKEVNVLEGEIVNKDMPLFTLDTENYEATIKIKEANIAVLEGELKALEEKAGTSILEVAQLQSELKLKQGYINHQNAPDNKSLQADLELAQKDLKNMKADYKSNEVFYENGAISEKELKDLAQGIEAKESEIKKLKANIDKNNSQLNLDISKLKSEINVKQAQSSQEDKELANNIEVTKLKIEVAKQELEVLKNQTKGVYIKEGQLLAAKDNLLVYDIGCVAGSQITNNTQVLAKCVEVNNLIVTLNIPTEDLGKIAMGSEVKLDVYTNQDKSIKGKISRISNHAEIIDGDSYIKADVTVDEGIELLKLDEKLDASIEIN